ncbi:helix-turn-helix domain-containing protein [Streptomyces sp. N2A]|uniref:ArsR/SmtB family transcription factor n=1 Tax=Streptomyces sp. N2A TaxID=3073936 RepID=UPI0028706FA7|nr:helix-turn-helix domain-containing protein [Streptomyces sp. N2A]
MIRLHFTAADVARVRFASRAAPLLELNTALMMMCRRDDGVLFGRWRHRVLRSLPAATEPLGDLVPNGRAPVFLDVFADSLQEGLATVRSARPELVRAEMERVYATVPGPPPPWIRGLHQGDAEAWRVLGRAQHAAFETLLRPVWSLVQDLHRAEFTRHALTVAEHGVGAALDGLVPGARLSGNVWECPAPFARDIVLNGRGVVLLPTFHWTGPPLLADLPGRPLYLTYPAGPGVPLVPPGADDGTEALAGVLGRTRAAMLRVLAREHTTGDLARRLGISDATASAHTAALRGAGLITTERAGRAVLHRRTALGGLLVRREEQPPGGGV